MKLTTLLITTLLFCISAFAQRTIVTENPFSSFRPNNYPNDSVLINEFKYYLQTDSTFEREGTNIVDGKIIVSPDGFFKMMNLYVEASGGATYNYWAENYLIKDDTIQSVGLEGEVYRIDSLPEHNYTIYTNSISRMGSMFNFYNFRMKGDSLFITLAKNYGNFIFNLIDIKKQAITERPNLFPGMQYDRDVANILHIDTNTIGDHEFYFLSDERFLSSESDTITSRIYYTHSNGDELAKYARLYLGDSEKDILLALDGGDSDHYYMTSEFINDSLYRRYYVSQEGTGSDYDELTFQYDSLVTDYWYNKTFDLQEIKTDTFIYQKKYIQINNEQKLDWQINFSNKYVVNGISCYWKMIQQFSYDANGELIEASNFNLDLLRTSNDSILLKGQDDIINIDNSHLTPSYREELIDLNYDGYNDFRIFNSASSGSAGDFYDGYLFDPMKKIYSHTDVLSGYNMELNPAERTVLFQSHSGVVDYTSKVYLTSKGKVDYIENIMTEVIPGDVERVKETYTKKVNGIIVKTRTKVQKRVE